MNNLKRFITRILSVSLMGFVFYQTFLSLQDLNFLVNRLNTQISTEEINTWLIKFSFMCLSTIADLTYGIFLTITSTRAIKTLHLIIGFVIFLASFWVSFNLYDIIPFL